MTKLVTAYYSKKTGARTTDGYALRNPDAVESLTLDPAFLRRLKLVKLASDGMPTNSLQAKAAKFHWTKYQSILEHRRVKAAAKRAAKKAAAVNVTTSVKKAAQKKATKKVAKKPARKKLAVALPAVPAAPIL